MTIRLILHVDGERTTAQWTDDSHGVPADYKYSSWVKDRAGECFERAVARMRAKAMAKISIPPNADDAPMKSRPRVEVEG